MEVASERSNRRFKSLGLVCFLSERRLETCTTNPRFFPWDETSIDARETHTKSKK